MVARPWHWLAAAPAHLRRDWRNGAARLLGLALVVAVGSLTSVAFFTDRVHRAITSQAGELLGGDLAVSAAAPLPPTLAGQARRLGLETTSLVQFRGVVVFGERLELAEVKAVQAGYPLRGRLRTAARLFGEERSTASAPPPGAAWLDARLIQLLGLEIGETVQLGAVNLAVTRVLTYEPDRGGDLFNIAPRLLMNAADLDAAGLIRPGSRVTHRLLAAGPDAALAQLRELAAELGEYQVRDLRAARPELGAVLDRAEQFLGLAALVSVALAGLAMALAAHRYAVAHFDDCAVMRCLGASQGTIITLYGARLAAGAAFFSVIGCVVGYLGQAGLAALVRDLAAVPLPPPALAPAATGPAAGLLMTLAFAMPQVLRLKNISPLRVLRRDLAPEALGNRCAYAAAGACLLLLTPWQAGRPAFTGWALAALAATALAVFLAGRLGIRCLASLRARVGVGVRFGLANIVRRGNLAAAQVLALGLGAMTLTLLFLVRTDLLADWGGRLPPAAPNYFLANIQPGEREAVQAFIRKRTGLETETWPVVRARLLNINGAPVVPENYRNEEARRFARRMFNLSTTATLPRDNRLAAGQWWDGRGGNLFSFEDEFARTLGIALDDELEFDILGERLRGKVVNLRRVEWGTFNVNFFVVANPGALNGRPATYLAGLRLPPRREQLLIDLVKAYPSVTVFDVDAILDQARRILRQAAAAVEFVFGFTLAAGLVVLAAALQTSRAERAHEAALLLVLGARRRQVLAGSAAEFAFLGLLAGLIAAPAAAIAQQLLARYLFELDAAWRPWTWLLVPLLCAASAAAAGLAATARATVVPPAAALRRD